MDFLTNTFSSLGLGSSEYTKAEKVEVQDLIWDVWQGTVRKDSSKCTIFECTNASQLPLANNFAKVLKRLRLPGLPKVIGEEITPKSVLVALEPIVPLAASLPTYTQQNRIFGLSCILTTLKHLTDLKCVLANIGLNTVWINGTGEWVLVGCEIASFQGDNALSYGNLLPAVPMPPEIASNGWVVASNLVDTWQFAHLCRQVLTSPPPQIQKVIAQGSAAKRPPINRVESQAFANPITPLVENINHILMLNEYDFTQLMRDAVSLSDDLSPPLISGKLIPALVQVYSNGGKGGVELVRLVLHLCARAESSPVLVKFIVSLFSSLDRAVRLELLQQMSQYINVLPNATVQQKVMPAMAVSFSDTEPLIRRSSLASVPILAPKLNNRQLNGDLLRLLAKTNNDTDPEIRAQTMQVLATISEYMEKSTRSSVVVAALAKSLKDPSPDVRQASLEALNSTSEYYSPKECAEKLLGPAAASLLDPRYEVRALGRDIVQSMLDKITTESERLDSSLEDGVLPSGRIITRDDTPSVAKLFRGDPSPALGSAVPPVPTMTAATSKAPPLVVPGVPGPSGTQIVEESAIYSNSGWDAWDDEPEPEVLRPQAQDLDPEEDDAEDGWGDDW